ncbi:DUF2837 family protein [Rudanella paleaurantiibacter]|uniref:Lipid II flippase Amj n=1 Tax=Rudanella paleaurantiibacter TaxID=2614655 RepID=A0A7J5U4H5_9BACT|nr:DUF2837 family protein [Rudanella paleaurantiibacter]KAB7732665.1 DUF2837 family protein [Rudanella paleaurantiibacter]
MNASLVLVIGLTFVITLIGTLALAVRIVGLRTHRWSMAYALFNIMVLVSRLASTLQAPLLAKTIETNIKAGQLGGTAEFRFIMFSATLATLVGGGLLPSFQRVLGRAVERYYDYRSIPKLMLSSLRWRTLRRMPAYLKWPDPANLDGLYRRRVVSIPMLMLNAVSSAVLTAGVLATLYAGYLNPDLRSTSASMSGLINGLATILATLFIDPDLALLTDEVVAGQVSQGAYRRYLAQTLLARLAGTVLAQVLLIPFAHGIVWGAEMLRV